MRVGGGCRQAHTHSKFARCVPGATDTHITQAPYVTFNLSHSCDGLVGTDSSSHVHG